MRHFGADLSNQGAKARAMYPWMLLKMASQDSGWLKKIKMCTFHRQPVYNAELCISTELAVLFILCWLLLSGICYSSPGVMCLMNNFTDHAFDV
jgi:hypothetical protein